MRRKQARTVKIETFIKWYSRSDREGHQGVARIRLGDVIINTSDDDLPGKRDFAQHGKHIMFEPRCWSGDPELDDSIGLLIKIPNDYQFAARRDRSRKRDITVDPSVTDQTTCRRDGKIAENASGEVSFDNDTMEHHASSREVDHTAIP